MSKKKSFSDLLPDFSGDEHEEDIHHEKHHHDSHEHEEVEDNRIIITQEELDSIKNEYYNKGKEDGSSETHEQLSSKFANSLNSLIESLEKSQNFKIESIKQISNSFVGTLTELIGDLTSKDISKTNISRDIEGDVKDLIENIKDHITIECSPEDKVVFDREFHNQDNVTLKEQENFKNGEVRILYNDSEIKLFKDEWQKKVHNRTMEAVYSLLNSEQSNKD